MAEQTRTRRTYDHRLRKLIQVTGDTQLATRRGIPRSTARTWLRLPGRDVVTLDVMDMTEATLRQEVLALRRRNERLVAILRLVVVLIKISGFTLSMRRVADTPKKNLLLRSVERSRTSLSLKSALRILGLSTTRYHSWKRAESCGIEGVSVCPRTSPQKLTTREAQAIKEMATSEEYRHVPTGNLAVLAQRAGKVFASPTTWYRLIRKNRWRRPRRRVYPEKPKIGIRASKPNEIWHVDTTIIRLLDGTRVYLHAVIDNFSRKILGWKTSTSFDPGSTVTILREAAGHVVSLDVPPTLLADGGVENFNAKVDELIDSGVLKRVLAMTDITFSNSLIEAWWKVLKHQWLYLNSLDSAAAVKRLTTFYVQQHNEIIPHSAFRGQTPDELYFGTGKHVTDELAAAKKVARQARLEENRSVRCDMCE